MKIPRYGRWSVGASLPGGYAKKAKEAMSFSEEAKARPLRFRNALRVKIAENWLALGEMEEALHELSQLPYYVRRHPEVLRITQRLDSLPSQMVELWLARAPRKRLRQSGA